MATTHSQTNKSQQPVVQQAPDDHTRTFSSTSKIPEGDRESGYLQHQTYHQSQHLNGQSSHEPNYLPSHLSLEHSNPSNLTFRLQDLSQSSIPSPPVLSARNSNTSLPMYVQGADIFVGSEPRQYPMTNSLTSLPQQISRALAQWGSISPIPNKSSSSDSLGKLLNSPPLVAPYAAQVPTPCSQDQGNAFAETPDDNQHDTSPLEYSPNWASEPSPTMPSEYSKPLHSNDYLEETKISQEVKESFVKLGPLLSNIRSKKWSGVLVSILSQLQHNISIDDFYNLLYNEAPSFECIKNTASPESGDQLRSLQVLHLVLITLQSPRATGGLLWNVSSQSLRIPVIQVYEILRTSLAIKIISTLAKNVHSSVSAYHRVSRVTLYKLYYILCQKLTQKFPAFSNYPGFREALTLGQLRLGKITNLVYPNIVTRKIGRRGDSKAHYMGLSLNYSILDEDTLRLAELEIPELMKYFKDERAKRRAEAKKLRGESFDASTDAQKANSSSKPSFTPPVTSSEKPLHCYIDSWRVYPEIESSENTVTIPKTEFSESTGRHIQWQRFWEPKAV